jgi:hypothetical protein
MPPLRIFYLSQVSLLIPFTLLECYSNSPDKLYLIKNIYEIDKIGDLNQEDFDNLMLTMKNLRNMLHKEGL